jgi:hypothetical protein
LTTFKDEGFNLNILTFALTFIVYCFALQLTCQILRSCFGHAMSKLAQYAIDDIKVCVGLSEVSLKET